jgi:hypothetical protein
MTIRHDWVSIYTSTTYEVLWQCRNCKAQIYSKMLPSHCSNDFFRIRKVEIDCELEIVKNTLAE